MHDKMPDEAPEHPAPRRKRSARFDNLGEKDEAETRLIKRALRSHAWASVEAGTESECESSSFLFDRTRRGFQRLVGNLKTENLFFSLDVLVSHRPSSSCSPAAPASPGGREIGENPRQEIH